MQGIPHYGPFLFFFGGGIATMGHTTSSRGSTLKLKRGVSGHGSAVGDQELVLTYPALNIRFDVGFVIVSFVIVVLGMVAAVGLWLSVLCVNQLLVLASWGWDDFFVDLRRRGRPSPGLASWCFPVR